MTAIGECQRGQRCSPRRLRAALRIREVAVMRTGVARISRALRSPPFPPSPHAEFMPLRFSHESFAGACPLDSAFLSNPCPSLAVYAQRPRSVSLPRLRFARRGQHTGGLTPPGGRWPCRAHTKTPRQAGREFSIGKGTCQAACRPLTPSAEATNFRSSFSFSISSIIECACVSTPT